jgi:hypothetical protein
MTTSKALRAAPTQVFEKYTLTRQVGPSFGLYPIATSQMKTLIGGSAQGGDSSTQYLDFNFKFNEIVYDKFIAGVNGWLVLKEKTGATSFNAGHYFTYAPPPADDSFGDNKDIKNTFSNGGILFCPWFDNLQNAYSDVSQTNTIYFPVANREKTKRGLILPPLTVDPVESGLKYVLLNDPSGGKCLVVRWRSFDHQTVDPSTVINFDIVIYESGKIEYRYDKRSEYKSSSPVNTPDVGATIAVFINDSSTGGWRFRDFSQGLGHPLEQSRTPSDFGGYEYDPLFFDNYTASNTNKRPYVYTLLANDSSAYDGLSAQMQNRQANWPGQDRFGCVMTFSPPTNHRRTLPRLEVKKQDNRRSYPQSARTGDSRLGKFFAPYDDRRSLVYASGSVLNFPVMLPRDYASTEAGAYLRRDLYGDFYATGSVTKFATDVFLGETPIERISPFSDHDRPEQVANSNTDAFFATGSSVGKFGFALSQGLKSKTQIKLELPINHQLQMFPTSSAIYYYNKNSKGFFVPQIGNASNDIMHATAALGTPDGSPGLYRPEDARGFGPIGNQVASGSSSAPMGLNWASDADFDQTITSGEVPYAWEMSNRTRLLSKQYDKSLPNNPDYVSLQDETFSLPINAPFLLEKAVFEIPFKMGPGWLNDKTRSSTPIGMSQFEFLEDEKNFGVCLFASDFAGPAITVSLFNQINSGSTALKDLIMTGTVISSNDNTKNVSLRTSWTNFFGNEVFDFDMYPLSIFEPEGFLSYGTPASIVNPQGDYFTGSISIKMESSISNGPLISFYAYSNFYLSAEPPAAGIRNQQAIDLMTSPYLDIRRNYQVGAIQNSTLKTVDVFGRNSKGSEMSGRSIFGNEFLVSQVQDGKIPNPLYVADSYDALPTSYKDLLDPVANPDFRFYTQFAVPITNTTASPYLVMPGDKLTLALSKMRPALASNGYDPISGLPTLDIFRDGLEHDVWVDTGSIKVTFYGSLLKESSEHHDTLNQNLDTDVIHDVIGTDLVLDQYDVEYGHSLYGTYVDDYVTGSLVSLVNRNIVTGSRGLVFSRLNATSAGYPQNVTARSESLQPWLERVGQLRFLKLSSEEERIYDSMTPNISDILSANGKAIGYSEIKSLEAGENVGIIYLNGASTYENLVDNIWPRNFPFAPDYSGFRRQFISNKQLTTSTDSNGDEIPEKIIDVLLMSLVLGEYFKDNAVDDPTGFLNLSDRDVSKLFFGFGEVSSGPWGNIPDQRENQGFAYKLSPIIRGWKYGLYSGSPAHSSAVFRRDRYGQFRDMLEQRINTVFHFKRIVLRSGFGGDIIDRSLVTESPISVKFINSLSPSNPLTDPSLTHSQNLSPHATSSLPYFDGDPRNRTDAIGALNQETLVIFPP